ncbi:MAG: carboxylesterase family protein, partial [Lachnospiraceae bacterium]|nr:carboxylesterase family protein [Lachnospiraceae bacterium]
TVFANYRVGFLGYLTHEKIEQMYGRDGNFGLDDQLTAVKWVNAHIADFGGDPQNITLMGQSAGAISIQYLCLNKKNEGLFRRVIMMSGGGMFPKFALPRDHRQTREYWLELMDVAGAGNFGQLKTMDIEKLSAAAEALKTSRKDTIYNTMPVVDGYLLPEPVDKLISDPIGVGYMLGVTNNDMYAPVLAFIGSRYGRANGAYIYYFDIDSPGDRNGAFHSCDLRYAFERLGESWRPYGERDREASSQLADYLANYAKTGDPNGEGLPVWKRIGHGLSTALVFGRKKTRMGRPLYLKLTHNMIRKGDPKAQA